MDKTSLATFTVDCSGAMSYSTGTPQHVAIYVHIVASVLSIIFTFLFLFHGRHLLFFHWNFKILTYVLLGGFLVHGITLAALQVVHSYVLWTATSLCDLYLSNTFCYWGRFPSAAATNLFVYCQMAMIIERIAATRHLGKYEKSDSTLGKFLAIVVISLSIVTTIIMFHKWDLSQSSTYCGTSNNFTLKEVFYVTSVFNSVVALGTFIGFFIVMYYNKKMEKENAADIVRRYQCAENTVVLKMLAPQTLFLCVFLVSYGTLNGITYFLEPEWSKSQIYKSALTFVNVIPYYTTLSPLLIWYLLKKHQVERKTILENIANDQRDPKQAYFDGYRAMWNS